MPAPELVIFDCDGVLVDSEIIASRVEAKVLTEAGFEITPEELARRYAGLTFKDILLSIEENAEAPLQATLIDRAESEVDRKVRKEVKPLEGVHEAVAGVTVPKCVCSNSSHERVEAMLSRTRLLPFFKDHIYSSLETPTRQPKPAPDVFLFAAEKFGAATGRCFVIEDSVHGIAGAKAAGMRVIGFTGGSHIQPGHADLLMEAGAETVIHRHQDLNGVVAALSEWSEDA
ncbi:HAD family hydrolase [Nitratireductor kimnyeongensis]|uniref:HAD family hydrolase n=1 Tax=Nitratireductor kimnyeongensis TaxID=430679 RepID=A0ABW0T5G8_9HYPH|nr:HAD family phosphatase [Nitratireductor kimnyeongensis]QZZ34935.1 HAD family phosphatase [Nitratireductor kimnyeongensis]